MSIPRKLLHILYSVDMICDFLSRLNFEFYIIAVKKIATDCETSVKTQTRAQKKTGLL